MVLRWFFDVATIAFNGFRWFRTIGQTMQWFRWIVVVYTPNLYGGSQNGKKRCHSRRAKQLLGIEVVHIPSII